MEQDRLSHLLPTIEQVLDRQPPLVTPETPLVDVLVRLGQVGGSCNLLPALDSAVESLSLAREQGSYVLVKEGDRLVGIFTERDLVRLIAADINLQQVRVAEVMTRELVTITLEEGKHLLAVLSLFRQHRIRHLPVVDDRGQLAGIITPDTIRQALQPFNFLKWQQVSEVMVAQVIQGSPTTSGLSLAQLMVEQQVSCVVIAQTDSLKAIFPLGIVTEGDILQYQALGLDLSQIQAQAIMSTPLFSVSPTDSLWLAHQEMQGRRVRRLGVRGKRGELLGIVTQTSLLQALAPVELFEVIETQQKMLEERAATLEAANRQLKQEIRSRQQTEAAMRQLNSELEQRVAQRTAQLEDANRALEEEIAKRKQAQEKLQHDVLHDGLTGLANRTLFLDHLQQAVNQCQRRQDKLFAVLFLDLDRFGEINKRFDHLVGDKLLVAVARRLERCQRAGDTVARFAGDEFVILLEDLAESGDASKVAARIHQVLKPPLVVDGHEFSVTASMGISFGGSQSPYQNSDQAEQLLRDADRVMFLEKAAKKAARLRTGKT